MSYRIDANGTLSYLGKRVRSVRSPNVGGQLRPRILVLHYTASGPAADIAEYFRKPEAKVSAHLVIRRDGSVAQCVPFTTVAWHAGKSTWRVKDGDLLNGLNQYSIGIEVENWGYLKRSGGGWRSWTGAQVDSSIVIEARHKYGTPDGGWEVYTEAQILAAVEVSQAICSTYGIEEIVGHDDISPGRKSDTGPAWNMASFKAKVFGRAEDEPAVFMVRSSTGLNIRVGPSVSADRVRPKPLPDGTKVVVHEADGAWRFVTVLNAQGQMDYSGWVHGGFLAEA